MQEGREQKGSGELCPRVGYLYSGCRSGKPQFRLCKDWTGDAKKICKDRISLPVKS